MKIKFQKTIALFLALALSLSALAACNSETTEKKKKKKKSNKNTTVSSENADSELSGELSNGDFIEDEEWEDEDPEEEPADEFEEPADEDVVYSTVKIYNQTPVQTDFLGFNAIYNAFAFRTDDDFGRNLTPKMAAEETARAAQTGIRIARSTYDCSLAYNSKTKTFDYNSEKMQGLFKFCHEMEKYDISVFLVHHNITDIAFEYYTWTKGGNTWQTTTKPQANTPHEAFLVEGDQQATYQKFANFMVETVKALQANGCKNVDYISALCEPGLYWYDELNDPENIAVAEGYAKASATKCAEINNILHRALVKAGVRNTVKLQGPNIGYGAAIGCLTYMKEYKKLLDEGANDLYSWHTYKGSDFTMDNYSEWNDYYAEFENEVDMSTYVLDEWNTDNKVNGTDGRLTALKGTQIALGSVAMLNHGVRTGYLWSLFDQLWVSNYSNNGEFTDGVQLTGLMPTLLQSSVVYPGYYAQSLMGTLVGKAHSTVYRGEDEGTNSVYAAMTEGQDGSKNILVVNINADDAYVTLDFEKSLGGKSVYRHVYNGASAEGSSNANLIGFDLKKTGVNTKLNDVLPGFSVVVYTTEKVKGDLVKK